MSEFIEVSKIAELKDGTMKVVLAQGREMRLICYSSGQSRQLAELKKRLARA